MAPKKSAAKSPVAQMTFEAAYAKLEEIVRLLEDGQLGLSESLARYEEGVKHLKHCHDALEQAERKILLLTGTDAEGNPVVEPFEDQAQTLEEKQESRGKRRSRSSAARQRKPADKPTRAHDDDMDNQRGLF